MDMETGVSGVWGFLVGGGVGFLAEGVEQMLDHALSPWNTGIAPAAGWKAAVHAEDSLPQVPASLYLRDLWAGPKYRKINTSGFSPQPAGAGVGR